MKLQFVYNYVILFVLSTVYISYFVKGLIIKMKGYQLHMKNEKSVNTIFLVAWSYLVAGVEITSCLFENSFKIVFASRFLRISGLFVCVVASFVFNMGMWSLGDSWRVGFQKQQKTTLITEGVYKFSRNPAFLGFILLHTGMAIAYPNILMIFSCIVAIIGIHRQVIEEEQFLITQFGKEYLKYKSTTPRYFLCV